MLVSCSDSELNRIYSRSNRLVRATASLRQGWKQGFGGTESAMTKQDVVKSAEGPHLGEMETPACSKEGSSGKMSWREES